MSGKSVDLEKPSQLGLNLALAPKLDRARFHVSKSNADALAMVDIWPRWPEFALLVCGPEGSGKTHLAHIWAKAAEAKLLHASDLAAADLSLLPPGQAIVIEDAHLVGAAEAQLFHLFNLLREKSGWLMLTARTMPDNWGLAIADLVSRLRLAPSVTISAPDDALVRKVLVKNLADRQLQLEPGVLDYVLVRMERSFAAAKLLAEMLDREALAQKSAISRSLAAAVLSQIYGSDDLFDAG